MNNIRTIVLADKEHPHEQQWAWRANRVTRADRFIGRGLISREDLSTLRVGDLVRVVKPSQWFTIASGEEVIGEARVGHLNNGSCNAGGQPWALFEARDPDTIEARNAVVELEHAGWDARLHWVPSPPPPPVEKPIREITAKPNPHCTTEDQIAFFEGDSHPSRGEVVLVNGEIKLRVHGSFPRVPDGSCTFWGLPA